MIRFVPVGEAIYPDVPEYQDSFAWFCTVSDKFLVVGGFQEWPSWEAFEEDWNSEPQSIPLERFRRLYCPPSDKPTDGSSPHPNDEE